jgi:deferrochelatase/peroxidase EfeB
LGFNGSYLVLRLLEQRSDAFREWLLGAGPEGPLQAAKVVGRWPNGASLAQFPSAEPSAERAREAPSYAQDAQGLGCPLGAHVRRASPRDALPAHGDVRRHRLLRRGRLYGEEGAGAGLLFVALNADIARQFEVVQGRWLNGPHFSGLRAERDPLVGSGDGERQFTIPAQPFRERIALPRLTRLLGGAYCFLPSLRALGYLADLRSLT